MNANAIALHFAILILCTCTYSTSLAFAFSPNHHPIIRTPSHFQQHPSYSRQFRSTQSPLHLIKDKKIQLPSSSSPSSSQYINKKRPSNYRLKAKDAYETSKNKRRQSSTFEAAASTTAHHYGGYRNRSQSKNKDKNKNNNKQDESKKQMRILNMVMPMPMDLDMDMDMPEFKEMMSNRTDFEMAVMSTLAITVPLGIIATLAMDELSSGSGLAKSSEEFTRDLLSLSNLDPRDVRISGTAVTILTEDGIDVLEDGIETLEALSMNVFDAAVPTTATDLISIALGEGIAAGIGSVVTATLGAFANTKGVLIKALDSTSAAVRKEAGTGLLANAISDADYFLTRAAALPLLGAVGLPPFLSVIVATIPSQLVKLSARQKEQRVKEDLYMEALLQEENLRKEKERLRRRNPLAFVQQQLERTTKSTSASPPSGRSITTTESNVPRVSSLPVMTKAADMNVIPGAANQVDFVEIFGDITKWLEYEVLINELGGTLVWNNAPLFTGYESAIFGFLASLSSQLYSDIIYRYFDAGLEYNREASRSRGAKDTAILYFVRCLSSATLFGVYESVRSPISNFITNLLSGGVDSCLGSDNFNLCLETYFVDNAPDASFEGEARAFFVAAMNLVERVFEGGSFEKSEEFLRSVFVQLNSLVHLV